MNKHVIETFVFSMYILCIIDKKTKNLVSGSEKKTE